MFMMIDAYVRDLVDRFQNDEEGLALTEYMLLLGLLTGAVITAVIAFGSELGQLWQAWADWMTAMEVNVPTTATTPSL